MVAKCQSCLCYTSSLPSSESVPLLTPEALHEANMRVMSLTRKINEAGFAHAKKMYYT